jgi:hypothetical protein
VSRSPYIVGRAYDWAFFLLPPTISLLLGIAISGSAFSGRGIVVAGQTTTAAGLFIGIMVHAHLVAVFLRSHGNAEIRQRHPLRFLAIPLLLWIVIAGSAKIAVAATLVATFWDVWHSGAQTFGFARIYDRNAGNPPELGRRLDFWLNQLLYAGPILAGVTLVDHLEHFDDLENVGVTLFSAVPAFLESRQRYFAWAVIGGGTLFLIVYVFYYVRLYLCGYRISPLKVLLLATTGACSIYTWGLNSWGEAFFIMNLFHAVQYLALVWHTEHATAMRGLRLKGKAGKVITCTIYLGAVFAYGAAAELVDTRRRTLWAITIAVSLLHFWYDGFVWSVRRREI